MSTSPGSQKLQNVLAVLVGAFFVVAIGFSLANYKSGPVEEIQATILSTRGYQTEGPTSQQVSLRLASGEVVLANTVPGLVASEGDQASVHRYRYAISGAASYEVYRIERGR